ncbi:MAG: efflux RND transporter periplasmic adaptor subunit [Bacteroidales bacterium]|nr:efflux RND transporter periplasmic adaptor subunit [Bacteroidales bacterium]
MNRALLILLPSALIAASCHYTLPVLRSGASSAPVKVVTMEVGSSSSEYSRVYVGEFEPARKTVVTAPFPGTLQRVVPLRGERVKAGDVLVEIRSQSVESACKMARAKAGQARDGYSRAEKVYSAGGVSDVAMVELRTALAEAEAALESAEKSLEDCKVKAPYDAMVSVVDAQEGVDVIPGAPLVTLMDVSSLKLKIQVGENDISSVPAGTVAQVDIPALGLTGLNARVTSVSPASSAFSHSYECTLALVRKPSGLLPGMGAKVRISVSGGGGIVIPAAAVQIDDMGKYVWLDKDGTVCKARIEVSGYSGKGVVVTGGLSEGDSVITSGYHKVSSGMKVTREK